MELLEDPRNTVYIASRRGTLSLASGGLDIDRLEWLYKSGELPQQTKQFGIVHLILIVLGFLMIALGVFNLIIKQIKKWKGKNAVLLLFIILFVGCSRSDLESTFLITPSKLDFGNVRSDDSPVEMSLTLQNNGVQPVLVTEIIVSCGCSAIDIPKEPILPKTQIDVPIKINLYGRTGDFDNALVIKTNITEPILVQITGKIISDIWLNGQSIRCTAESGKTATTFFEVYTVDYPDVQFDWSQVDSSFTIKEISRTTKNNETVIKFFLLVNIDHAETNTLDLTLIPIDMSITPLTVPVYWYTEGNHMFMPTLKTQAINLGAVLPNEKREIGIYGDPDLIYIINQVCFVGSPDGISLTLVPSHDEMSDAVFVMFQFPDLQENQVVEGHVKITTIGKKEIKVPVSGLVR